MPLAPPITLIVSDTLALPLAEIELSAIRSQGAGGQKVNKTSSAVQLRFDVVASSLADDVKARLLERSDRRSEEHTSELQSLMRSSYAVFCLKKKTPKTKPSFTTTQIPSKQALYAKLE